MSVLSDNTPVYTRFGVGLSPWLRSIVLGAVKLDATVRDEVVVVVIPVHQLSGSGVML